MNEKIRVGIVGGGIGGVFTGALLSNQGYDVEIFDKNPILGGYCQAFKRKENKIHPAVLRVGSQSCADMIDEYCLQAGIGKLDWTTYTEYYQFGPDIKINQCTPRIDLELAKYFPAEQENIEKFFAEVRDLYEIMNKVFENNMTFKGLTGNDIKKYIPNISKTAIQFVEEFFEDKLLIDGILAMLELDDKSVALAIPMTYFEIKGQGEYFVPKGGAYAIISKCVQLIERNGGKVHKNAVVTKITTENNRGKGLVVNGEEHQYDVIISGVDIIKTYHDLIGAHHIENKEMLKRLKEKWKISKSSMAVWIGFDDTLENLGIERGSVICYPNEKRIREVRNIMQKENEELPEDFWYQLFTAFSTDEESTPKGKSQMCVGVLVPYNFQNKWGGKDGYQETKKEMVERILAEVEKRYPKVKGHYEYVEAATPISYERECWNSQGAYLGFEKYENFVYDRGRHQNQGLLDNLYFASHWVSIIGGVAGVMQECAKTLDLVVEKHPIKS